MWEGCESLEGRGQTVVERIIISQKCPHSIAQNLWYMLFYMAKENQAIYKIKITDQLTLRDRNYSDSRKLPAYENWAGVGERGGKPRNTVQGKNRCYQTESGVVLPDAAHQPTFRRQRLGDKGRVFTEMLHYFGVTHFLLHQSLKPTN